MQFANAKATGADVPFPSRVSAVEHCEIFSARIVLLFLMHFCVILFDDFLTLLLFHFCLEE